MGDHAITLINEPGSSECDEDGAAPTFDELFNEHHQKVLLASYRVTGNLQDAEDIVQAVFLGLLKRGIQTAKRTNSAAYLCRSAINASLDLLRSRARTQTEQLNEESHPSTTGAADADIRKAEQRQQLRAALFSIDQRAAEVFALRVFEDFSNSEIAVVLDTSSNSVAVTYHKARAQLQQILGELEGLEGEDR